MSQTIIGIDVSKLTLDVVLMQNGIVQHKVFPNNLIGFEQLVPWTHTSDQAHVCLEATGQYGFAVAEYLYSHGYQVSVVNPARIKAYAVSKLRRNKTDKADAKLIAEFCEREKPTPWSPPSASFQALKALVHHLDDLQSMKTQECNRMEFSSAHPLVNKNLQEHLVLLNDHIQKVKKAIHAHFLSYPNLKHLRDLLVSIPGIGELTAAWVLSEIRDFHEFKNARQLTAYAGLNPRKFVSGSSIHKKPRLSKMGNSNLRKALFMPAIVAMNHNPVIMIFSDRLASRGIPKMAVVGAAMRKLLCLAYGVMKNDLRFDPDFVSKKVFYS